MSALDSGSTGADVERTWVVIKSCNRAFMLDLVITSVKQFAGETVAGIVIADDGTPEPYLDEVRRRHPDVVIVSSGRVIDPSCPGASADIGRAMRSWRAAVEQVTGEYFLLLEDDVWLTASIDLTRMRELLRTHHTVLLRLMPQNRDFEELPPVGAVTGDASSICRVGRPRFLATAAARPWFRYLQFSQFSGRGPRFVLWRLARRLGLHPRVQWVKNYQAYAIAGAVFERSWWLRLWSPEQDRLNEGVQLAAAIRSLIEDPLLTVGYVEPAVARTSIKTSAMEDAQQGRPDFAVSVMNQALNEAWLRGGWTVGGPSAVDLDVDSVVGVFASAGLPQAFAEQWIGWWSAVEANYDRVGFPLAP